MKNVCPQCSQITLSFDNEATIKCPLCETIFESDVGSGEKEDSK